MRTHVMFNGIDLTSLFNVSDLEDALLPREVSTVEVPGMDGALFAGVKLSQRSIKLTLTVKDDSLDGVRAASRLLAAILAVKQPAPLSMSIDGGLYFMAVPKAQEPGVIFRNAVRHEVEFVIPDPVAYGDLRTITVPSGGSVTFTVGGTYPTMPTVEDVLTVSASDKLWRLSLEDGTYLAYEPSYDGATRIDSLAIDCPARTLKVNGYTEMLTAESLWLELMPGTHTLTLDGSATSGPATVTFRERWM